MLKPLLLVLGAVAFVGALMLGGWALTGGGADLPASQAPAAGFTTADPSAAEVPAGTQPQPAGEVPQPREQQDALGEDTSAGDLSQRARERLSRSGTAAPAPVRRTARPPATSPVPAD
ncbi:MAG TPA: hypothetical protein VNA28_02165, partial [Solirubrobacteraceae bacterium]|nr:hypothetical protein [Solirubrobacteraceae bacterium]